MDFEPISGTIGAVAFADQMFARCVWVYKKYKLSKSFGSDYIAYTLKYHCEIARFEEIISHPHDSLRETALDVEQRHLREPLRSRLLLWMSHLQECENLVAECERKLQDRDDDAAEQASIKPIHGTQVPEPRAPAAVPSSALDTLASSTVSPTASASLITPSLAVESSAISATESVTLSLQKQKRQSKRRRFLGRLFRSRQHENPLEPARRPQSLIEQNALIADEQQPVPQLRSPFGSSLLPAAAADASVEMAGRAADVHGRSSLLYRARWVANSRSDFIALLGELREHADYFNSMIQLGQSRGMVLGFQQAAELRTIEQYRDIGDRLRMLLQSLHGLTGSNQAVFQLMLHHDPLSLQSKYRRESRLLSFQSEGAAFYARLLSERRHNSPRYFVFDVQGTSASPPETMGTIAATTLSSVSHLLDSTVETAQGPTWARELGHIRAASTTTGPISVFSDSTIHQDAMTFAGSLNNERERRFFQVPSQASSRTQLALVLACSLIYVHRADGPRELNATELTYYATNPASGQAADLSHSRINPFVLLQMVGLPTTTASSHTVLTSAARDDGDETMSMIRSLGTLLYEIGSWTVSVGNTIAERANFVKARKAALTGTISVKYHDAIDLCLGVRREALGNLETWMVQNVVGPLEQAHRDVRGLQLIT